MLRVGEGMVIVCGMGELDKEDAFEGPGVGVVVAATGSCSMTTFRMALGTIAQRRGSRLSNKKKK
jgi:hypothetical protein